MFDRYRQERRWQAARPAVALGRDATSLPDGHDWRDEWLPLTEDHVLALTVALALPVVAMMLELCRVAVGL